jgi:tetratricopeptide (TPR) repeat protein
VRPRQLAVDEVQVILEISASSPSLDAVRAAACRSLVRRRAACACRLVVSVLIVAAAGCTPPLREPTPGPTHTRYDSLIEAEATTKSPEWRALHYPAADLHGPFERPKLPEGADTNDPAAYYKLGDSVKWRLQGLADRAYYWAVRLDPTMAEAYYARWDLRRHGTHHHLYPDGAVRSVDDRAPNETGPVDSLRRAALVYNPFLDDALDIPPQISGLSERQANRDPVTAGLWGYARGDYRKAVKKLGEAIQAKPDYAGLHVPRAYAWVHLQESDSAVADLTALIHRIQQIQDSSVAPYLSTDFLYYSIGLLRAGQKRYAESRAAYESALLENLGFYMAHVRLSASALLLHDTTTALNELETATLIRADDPMLLVFRASILTAEGRWKEAETQLRSAIHADTEFALPYAFLGHVAEQRHDTTAARARYVEYLARASHTATERAWVEDHLANLTTQQPRPE